LPVESLHLPVTGLGSGLAWCARTEAFPEFEQIRLSRFRQNRPIA
jgi:hypothetical protein